MATFDADAQRRLLELSFEPRGNSFVYYENRWAPGRLVSAEERADYLNNWVPGSAKAFKRRLQGRDLLPPRSEATSRTAQLQMLSTIPKKMAVGLVLSGLAAIVWSGSASLPWIHWFLLACGILLVLIGLVIAIFAGSRRPS